uniref:Protein kinase domain-containing protein n=1 Tax=Ascaris lumbricoides TaxID=6252 RepID=A0A0M3ID08_ASCLU
MAENDVNVVDKDGSESTASGNETQMMSAESLTKRSANGAKTKQTSTDETPLKILNGLPMMKTDEIFDHRFRIYERIGWDDRVGATYFGLDEKENKEVILRIDRNDNALSVVKMEAVFLREAEKHHLWIFFEQVHSQAIYQQFCYLAIYHRDGPSLTDCTNYMKDHRFSHGTAGRLAYDILNILEAIHKLGYLLRSMHPSMFYLDVNSRHLFLFDRTTIQVDADQLQIPEANRWVGGPQYAPLAYHRGGSIKRRDELESLFYLLIEMVTGSLPWDSARADQIEDIKQKCIQQGVLLVGLPHEYARLQDHIMKIREEINYQFIGSLLKKIYQELGGVHDLDENFDFERDPTEEELPKFLIQQNKEFFAILIEAILRKRDRIVYARLQDHIMKIREEINYQFIGSLLKKIYQELGGVHDLDENFDFERDPTEEELPKFVLEKDTKTQDLEGKDGANVIACTDRKADTDNIGINENQLDLEGKDGANVIACTYRKADTDNIGINENQPVNPTLKDENMAIRDERTIASGSQDRHHTIIDELSAQLSNIHLRTNDEQFDAEKENQPMETNFPQTRNVPPTELYEDEDHVDV